jgi:hypothetical protein
MELTGKEQYTFRHPIGGRAHFGLTPPAGAAKRRKPLTEAVAIGSAARPGCTSKPQTGNKEIRRRSRS